MTKEKITLKNVKADLLQYAKFYLKIKLEWRLLYLFPFVLIALPILLFVNVWIGLIPLLPALYHIAQLAYAVWEYKGRRAVIEAVSGRDGLAINTETVSHLARETVYEPHRNKNRVKRTREAHVLYFSGSCSWRIPTSEEKLYAWSKELWSTPEGISNRAVKGVEYLYIAVQGHPDLSFIYPLSFFSPDVSLQKPKNA